MRRFPMPDRVVAAIDRLAESLEKFREAYEAWLRADGHADGERERLMKALLEAEKQLDEARHALDAVQRGQPRV